ncbi:hypothetical protein [Roseibacillus persicicus]|uniref:Lipoprotein n=1 Tax=Roseibacillus persicicus TaxID=454148 RepID=A0A918WGJ9_9BACT|nr:hypothetical protein [Roseibacillus persicicus]GHC44461.1 hypothetical protein GCM10007100_07200 [Roseibacillus persicicus]
MKTTTTLFFAGALCLGVLATACGPTTPRTTLSNLPQSSVSVIDPSWEKANEIVMSSLNEGGSLAALSIPVLRAPSLESSWGKPSVETSPQGFYRLTYEDPNRPFERLLIYGSPKPFPRPIAPPKILSEEMVNGGLGTVEKTQRWQSTTVLGQTVPWYIESTGGGADGEYFSTVGIRLTGPDDRVGYYRLVIETITGQAPARFSKVGW